METRRNQKRQRQQELSDSGIDKAKSYKIKKNTLCKIQEFVIRIDRLTESQIETIKNSVSSQKVGI